MASDRAQGSAPGAASRSLTWFKIILRDICGGGSPSWAGFVSMLRDQLGRLGDTPFTHGTHEYTRIMKTVALREALDEGGYDAAFGGARRDEERSRAKERVFSLREPGHRWEPRKQRPEFWRTANTQLSDGQTMRVFPIVTCIS